VIHDAYRFLIPILLLGILSAVLGWIFLAILFVVLALFIAFFFRNPKRMIPNGNNLVVSPADGKIVKIVQSETGEQYISIFLSIFDVHVNRAPISGMIGSIEYRRGKFKAAFDDEASRVNEQNLLTIKGDDIQVTFKQIAGLIARRVLCWKKMGDNVDRGELVGLIRFGSRVDIILPEKVNIRVHVGERAIGGSTILGDYV
jgi:phosphatidylserine decarboxylase